MKRRDAFIAGFRIDGRENDKNLGFVAVGDPEFLTVEFAVVAFVNRAGFQGESI